MAAQVAFKNSIENPRLDFEINALEMDALNEMIISTIRTSDVNNITRNIIITGGGQNSQNAPQQISDAVIESDNYLIASFHYYQPFSFTSSSTANNNDFNWGTNADKNSVDGHFDAVKNWSNSKNIPVTLGETRLRTETAGIVAVHSVAFVNETNE